MPGTRLGGGSASPPSAASLEDTYILPTYAGIRMPLDVVRGKGSYVFDARGAGYLDLYGGHAVLSLGHGHPRWVREIKAQLVVGTSSEPHTIRLLPPLTLAGGEWDAFLETFHRVLAASSEVRR
jgi:4-aminobutyrate aminotransferase-like enzyme